jgi:hypothetical protein
MLKVLHLALLVVLVAPPLSRTAEIRVRKHVDDMTAAEWRVLGEAIAKLKSADVINSDGSAPFPQSHDSYEWFVQIHGDRREAGGCQHASEQIWAWHRAFLLHFENRLRASGVAGGDRITLPYWDWTEVPSGTRGFPAAYEQTGSPLNFSRAIWPSGRSPLELAYERFGAPLSEPASAFVSWLVAESDWKKFGGSALTASPRTKGTLESRLHDIIHAYIGTVNANTVRAVRDPIFWAHHANLDRLWDEWQGLHTSSPLCLECATPVYDRSPELGSLTVGELVDDGNLPGDVSVVYRPRGPDPAPIQTLADARSNGVMTFSLRVPDDIEGARFLVRLDGVKVPMQRAYTTALYLHPQSVRFSTTPAFARQYAAGAYGNFPLQHDDATARAHTEGISVEVDVTTALRRIPQNQRNTAWSLTIRVVPNEASVSYASVADEVGIGKVSFLRQDAFSIRSVPLGRR